MNQRAGYIYYNIRGKTNPIRKQIFVGKLRDAHNFFDDPCYRVAHFKGWVAFVILVSVSETYPAVAGYRSTRQAGGTDTTNVQDMKVFTSQRTTETEGSVQKAGNPNLRARDTLFIRLPLLLYVPD